MIVAYMRGHEIYFDDLAWEWRYSDTEDIADDRRACVECKQYPTIEGYDPCVGYIEGASAACCGHGVDFGYVKRA